MNILRARLPKKVAGITVVEDPEALSVFIEPACAGAIWRRKASPDFQNWVDSLPPEQLPQGRVVTRADAVSAVVAELCEIAQTPVCRQRDQLIDDVAALADVFSDLMKPPYLRVRLQVVTSNACRKFHTDALTARLVCTYRGTGTQYGIATKGHDPARVFTVPTCAPILLRGTQWPETPASGLLHRSPPIEGTGETRLVLVLDPVHSLEDAA
ncbi:DUF1826 domain-containing protein [Yoonia sp. I 8.24]|uniref:DUF1826 domain-containing protein n=1 Tax=Yoonia sp. I 8.24 TaxID=1537229 RepID=UPI001EE00E28|nr:DUF1826 domain-containing protein [Yoonia sp. I 8.24]MCG3268068.1 DUF1826 domain-containing protein [Yoonia sp. I 8.24]